MASVVRLRTRQDAEQRQAASALAEHLQQIPDELLRQLPAAERQAISGLVRASLRQSRSADEGLWPGGFVMLSRDQTAAVWNAIRKLPAKDRPRDVRDAFMLMLLNIRQDTGELVMSRDEFAAELGILPRHVSTVMSTLERIGVVRRERWREPGTRGPGVVTYYVNANVAWNGSLDIRKREAAKSAPPSLRVVKGGVE